MIKIYVRSLDQIINSVKQSFSVIHSNFAGNGETLLKFDCINIEIARCEVEIKNLLLKMFSLTKRRESVNYNPNLKRKFGSIDEQANRYLKFECINIDLAACETEIKNLKLITLSLEKMRDCLEYKHIDYAQAKKDKYAERAERKKEQFKDESESIVESNDFNREIGVIRESSD